MKDVSDKRVLSKLYKELLKPGNKEKNNPMKYGPKTLTDSSPKKICRRQTLIWKSIPHHLSSGEMQITTTVR